MARIAAPAATIGGAAVAAAGLLDLVRQLDVGGAPALLPIAAVVLAVGCVLLAVSRAVVRSWAGVVALGVARVHERRQRAAERRLPARVSRPAASREGLSRGRAA